MSTPSYMKADRTPFPWRIVLPILLPLVLLVGGFFLVRHILYAREVAKEKTQINQFGVPNLMGPVSPGGPFFGEGDLAELTVSDNGWNKNQFPDGTTTHTIFATVHNKSGRTWDHIQVFVDLYGDEGKVGTKRGDVGTLAPGQDGTANLPDMGGNVNEFRVVGVDGR